MKAAIDDAFAMGGCDKVRNVIVYRRTGGKVAWTEGRDKWMHDVVAQQPTTCDAVPVSAEHPLFILYTSGSTGKPKGVQHSTGGYLLWAVLTMKWTFDIKPSDVFWCTADVGWVTRSHVRLLGPLAVGATEVIFEGVPTYPDAGRFWKVCQVHGVTIFYTAPTAIRSLIKAGGELPKKYDLSKLRLLGTVSEPINPEAWMWYHEIVGERSKAHAWKVCIGQKPIVGSNPTLTRDQFLGARKPSVTGDLLLRELTPAELLATIGHLLRFPIDYAALAYRRGESIRCIEFLKSQ